MDIVKTWVDYWTLYTPNKPWIFRVRYGLQCLADKHRYSSMEGRIGNVMWYAMETYDKLGKD